MLAKFESNDLRINPVLHLPEVDQSTIEEISTHYMLQTMYNQPPTARFHGIEAFLSKPDVPKPPQYPKPVLAMAAMGGLLIATMLPNKLATAQAAPGPGGTSGENMEIVHIGDSISVGADRFGNIREEYENAGVQLTFDAAVGRPLILAGCETSPPSDTCLEISDGLRISQQYSPEIERARVVVDALGTNDTTETLRNNLMQNVRSIHTSGNADGIAPIILIPELFFTTGGVDEQNEIIRDTITNELRPEGIDVRIVELTDLNIPTSDGVHPTSEGARQLARTLVSAAVSAARENLTINPPQSNAGGRTGNNEQPNANGNGGQSLIGRVISGAGDFAQGLFGRDNETPVANPVEIDTRIATIDFTSLWNSPANRVDPTLAPALLTSPNASPELNSFGIFYENGQAMTYLSNFTDQPVIHINEGFADSRDLGNGPFDQGNTDVEPGPLYAPAPGRVYLTRTSGEGNKLVLEIGYDEASGKSIVWYATHLENNLPVTNGQFVTAGTYLGRPGGTGISLGPHNSIGAGMMFMEEIDKYQNSQEDTFPVFDLMPGVPFECGPTAQDDPNEICGPTTPGIFRAIPLHPSVVAQLASQASAPVSSPNTVNNDSITSVNIDTVIATIDFSSLWTATPANAEAPVASVPVEAGVNPVVIDMSAPIIDWSQLFTEQGGNNVSEAPLPAAPEVNEENPAAEAPSFGNADSLRELFNVNNYTFDNSRLVEHIRQNAPKPNDARFPEGYVMFQPIQGLVEFDGGSVTQAEQFLAPETAAFIYAVAFEHARLQAELTPGTVLPLMLGDATSDHREHHNGGDIDILLPINSSVRERLFYFTISLLEEDGRTPVLEHIITGDSSLEYSGNQFLSINGINGAHIALQEDHGAQPGESAHWHASLDDGYSGNGLLPEADVELNDSDPVAVVGGSNPGTTPTTPEAPAQQTPNWLQNVPPDMREFLEWLSQQPECATVDIRTVAAEYWVENRGWVPINEDWSDNEHSSADAAGPLQFIPKTWFGRGGVGWDRVNDPSAYNNNAMARDGDGDGIMNPYDIQDSGVAACVHNQGSAGMPITHGIEGLTGDLTTDLRNLMFYKGKDTLLGHIANYNGDGGTASNVALHELPYGRQNPDYIRLAAALLLSDFTQAITVGEGDIEIIEP